MKIYTYDSGKNKEVVAGNLEGKIFHKKVTHAKHFMYKERSYGISDDVLQQLIEKGCTTIRIETESVVYESDIKKWFEYRIKNYGHGNQRFLPLHETKIVELKSLK